jgi:hypothetical protein
MQLKGNQWHYQDTMPPFNCKLQQVYGWCRPCNSTIMCQNRWWLKLFFYLLDVGTSNALVLYNKLKKMRTPTNGTFTPMNMVTFKMELVEGLVGRWMDSSQAGQPQVVEHVPMHIQGSVWSRCAYCASLSQTR